MRRFLDRQSGKRTELDDSGQFSVDRFEAIVRVKLSWPPAATVPLQA
jgi:hypothetical protein